VARTVKLSAQQWADLKDLAPTVTELMENGKMQEVRVHIGENTFITAKPSINTVDIREFFIPMGAPKPEDGNPEDYFNLVLPTRRGVQLSAAGWKMLITKGFQLIEQFAPADMSALGPCSESHEDEEVAGSMLRCYHCNPNACYLWL
jgi:hypothetical protein